MSLVGGAAVVVLVGAGVAVAMSGIGGVPPLEQVQTVQVVD